MSARLEGIILRKKVLRDNDLLLNVFTLSDGRIKLTQKRGLKKPKAELDLFCHNEFIVSENKDFALIYQSSSLNLHAKIRNNYELLSSAAHAVRTIEDITGNGQPNPGLYALLLKYFATLDNTPAPAELDNLKLEFYKNILISEGIYDGKKVTEKSFQCAIEGYRG